MLAEKLSGAVGNAANPTYIEDVFSTYLFTGTSAAQTITNNIDLSTKGGLVWMKDRTAGATWHQLFDTARGGAYSLATNVTDQQYNLGGYPTRGVQFNTNGFSVNDSYNVDISGNANVSWTFRKQPKFFDVVTWTGNGVSNRQISHNLQSVPGAVIVKCTSTTSNWNVAMPALGDGNALLLNTTGGLIGGRISTLTSTTFQCDFTDYNVSGETYVAYCFASNAGGFGLTGTDNVISCGSFSGSGTQTINLGWEPQFILLKSTAGGGPWYIADNMRGLPASTSATVNYLKAESSGSEITYTNDLLINSTGFTTPGFSTQTCIYIAIRRGPMKVPTDATKVFDLQSYTGNSSSNTSTRTLSLNISPDATLTFNRVAGTQAPNIYDKLRGTGNPIWTSGTYAETSPANTWGITQGQNSVLLTGRWNDWGTFNNASDNHIGYYYKRAPSFFDEVCYTGTGSATTQAHNLTVAPELMIIKSRSSAGYWPVYAQSMGNTSLMYLNTTDSKYTGYPQWNSTSPTSSVFSIGAHGDVNSSGVTYIAYLFATCAGVSKVGSYTGNGTTQTINCGFTGGARFVLIKRTDSTGDWYVWDTARGIIAANDPHLSLNTTAAEVTTDDTIDPDSTGFIVNQLSATNVNVSSATYIYLAIA